MSNSLWESPEGNRGHWRRGGQETPSLAETITPHDDHGNPPQYMSRIMPIDSDEVARLNNALAGISISTQLTPLRPLPPTPPHATQAAAPSIQSTHLEPVRRATTTQISDVEPERKTKGRLERFTSIFKKSSKLEPIPFEGGICYPRLYPFRRTKGSETGNEFLELLGTGTEKNNIRQLMSSDLLDDGLSHVMPLWRPELKSEQDTAIGDIGYFSRSSGQFHTLFNIFLTYEENLEAKYNPPLRFRPVPGASSHKSRMIQQSSMSDNHYVKGFERVTHIQSPDDIQFQRIPETTSGIIISLNHGSHHQKDLAKRMALRQGFLRLQDVKMYFFHSVANWYQHATQCCEEPVFNGSLLMVEQTVATKIWATASSTTPTPVDRQFIIRLENRGPVGTGHDGFLWRGVGSPTVSTADSHEDKDVSYSLIAAIGTLQVEMDKPGWKKNMGRKQEKPATTPGVAMWGPRRTKSSISISSVTQSFGSSFSMDMNNTDALEAYDLRITHRNQ